MAIFTLNSNDLSSRLTGFELKCKECGSTNVTLDIDQAAYPSAGWLNIWVSCDDCKYNEEIYSND